MTQRAPARVLVVGDANPDLVLRGDVVPRFGQAEQLLDDASLVLGGSAAITACGLARLGVPTALAAVVGDDLFGREVLAWLAAAGVSTEAMTVLPGATTGFSVHLAVPGDRAILTLPGTIPAIEADAVRTAIARVAPAHVHLASPFLTPALTQQLPELLPVWRASGLTTSLDPNWDPSEQWTALAPVLPLVDVLLPNAAELDALSPLPDPAPHLVVKAGADGAWSRTPEGERTTAPGLRVDVVDTTGAGDSFDAGYLAAHAHGVAEESTRLRWAAAAGSLSTRAAGGTSAQPTLHELRSAMVGT